MSQYYRLLSGFRLLEFSSVFLIVLLLNALCITIYKVYLINAYALNQAHMLVDLKTRLSIDSAYTGYADGAKDYKELIDGSGYYAEQAYVSADGHISVKAKLTDEHKAVPDFVKAALDGKTLVLHKNINSQDGYDFVSWHCVGSQNDLPFKVIGETLKPTVDAKYYDVFCEG